MLTTLAAGARLARRRSSGVDPLLFEADQTQRQGADDQRRHE